MVPCTSVTPLVSGHQEMPLAAGDEGVSIKNLRKPDDSAEGPAGLCSESLAGRTTDSVPSQVGQSPVSVLRFTHGQ